MPMTPTTSPTTSAWKLQLVSRVDAFRTCLAEDDHDRVHFAFSSVQLRADFDELSSREMEAIGTSPAQDTHLDRYKKWKLDDAKIEELTSVRMDSGEQHTMTGSGYASAAVEAVYAHVTDMNFFARGKRGVLFTALLRGRAEQVVVKFAGDPRASTSSTAAGCWVETEAKWIRIMNRAGIGARLEAFGTGWLICERLDGKNIVEFLSSSATHLTARWALREILCQCFTMDSMGINKEEMTHPTRHIIIHSVPCVSSASQRRWRCTFIDFEKCSFTKKPKNVTQVCQFVSSPRMTSLFQAKGVTWDIQSLRLHTKRYKLNVSSESFGALLNVFGSSMSRHQRSWQAFVERTLQFDTNEHLYYGVCFISKSGGVDYSTGCFQSHHVVIGNEEPTPFDASQFSRAFDQLTRIAMLEEKQRIDYNRDTYTPSVTAVPSIRLGSLSLQVVSANFASLSAVANAKSYGLTAQRFPFGILVVVFRHPHTIEDVISVVERCCAALRQ